jgi:hypothetical protein
MLYLLDMSHEPGSLRARTILITHMVCLQWSALLPVVLTLIATQQKDTILADLCYTKWALEAFVIANAQKYVWLSSSCLMTSICIQIQLVIATPQPDKNTPFLFSLWFQLFRSVANNTVWLAGQERLRH